jgi:hypothetical protein
MLPAFTSTINRKSLALAIVLVIAGLAPVMAIVGFCKRMPCCSQASEATAAFSTERNDCCATIACYESPSLTTAPSSADVLLVAPALVTIAPAPSTARLLAQAFADTSPPTSMRHRLAVLSTLLI